MRRAARRDIVEPEIVAALEKAGCLVYRSLRSDLMIHRECFGPGMFKVLECKSTPYTDARQSMQRQFQFMTGSPTVRSAEEALKEVGL